MPNYRFSIIRFTLLSAGILALVLLHASSAQATVVDDIKQKISDSTSQMQKLQREITQYKQQIDQTTKQADTLKTQITQLDLTDKKLTADMQVTQVKISTTQTNIQSLASDIDTKQMQIDNNHAALASSLRDLGEVDDTPIIVAALTYSSFSQFWNIFSDLERFQGGVDAHLAAVRDLKTQLESTKQTKEVEKQNLVALKSSLDDQHQVTVATKDQKDQLLSVTKNQEAAYRQLVADRQKKMQQLESEVNSYEAQLKTAVNASSLPSTGTHILSYPVDDVKITQTFGDTPFSTANPQVYNGHGHNGVDFGVPIGTPVHAAADGVVVDTGDTDAQCYKVSYGKWVLVKHDNGLATLYAHFSLIKAVPGQTVKRGDTIGYSGTTGYSTGPHVHFTVYASQAVQVSSTYVSKVCGTNMKLPLAPLNAYLNPLSYL